MKTLITTLALLGATLTGFGLTQADVDRVAESFNCEYTKLDKSRNSTTEIQPVSRDMLRKAMEVAMEVAGDKTKGQALLRVPGFFDSDDHTRLLLGILRDMSDGAPVAAGYMHVPGHVFLVIVMEDGHLYRFEPATREGITPTPQKIGVDRPGYVFIGTGVDSDGGGYVKPSAIIL